jgi:nucleotide-binding universal stress UspA family protein
MYKRILMAYNGTREGRAVLFASTEIAAFAEAETHLLAVASIPSSMFPDEGVISEGVMEDERKRMQDVLDEGLATLKERGFSVAGHLSVGPAVEEICRLASELKCDLVVVGHRQKHSFAARWWRGSVGATLLDYAPCSVLIAIAP